MYSVKVGFITVQPITAFPPTPAGALDSVWVRVSTRSSEKAKEAARRKISECYGVDVTDLQVYQSSWHKVS